MPYAKINQSGCETWHKGLVKVRYDLFLTPDDFRYDETYKYVPVITEPYPGKVDKEGNPRSQADYQAWLDKLPHIWQLNPIVSHFIRFAPEVSQEEVERAIEPHIPNFYKAWCEGWDSQPGGMRHGWDVATRWRAIGRPKRYDKEYSEIELAPRITACESKLALIVASDLTIVSDKEGETFPSTDIDVGSAAIDRAGYVNVVSNTAEQTNIDFNNAANATGVIDTVDIYVNTVGGSYNIRFGTFVDNGSASFTCRDAEGVGTPAGTGLRSFAGLDIDITSGDYIGVDVEEGSIGTFLRIDETSSGGSGVYYKSGAYCVASSTQTYNLYSDDILSLYGTGETAEVNVNVDVPLCEVSLATGVPGFSGGCTLTVPLSEIALALYEPTAGMTVVITVPLVNLDVALSEPTFVRDMKPEVPCCEIDLAGGVPTFIRGCNFTIPPVGLDLATYEPIVREGVGIDVPVSEFTVELFVPTFIRTSLIDIPASGIEVALGVPTIVRGATLSIPLSSLSLEVYDPTISCGCNLTIPLSEISLAINAPSLSLGTTLAMPAAAIEMALAAPTFIRDTIFGVPVAEIDVAGLEPTFVLDCKIDMPTMDFDVELFIPVAFVHNPIKLRDIVDATNIRSRATPTLRDWSSSAVQYRKIQERE